MLRLQQSFAGVHATPGHAELATSGCRAPGARCLALLPPQSTTKHHKAPQSTWCTLSRPAATTKHHKAPQSTWCTLSRPAATTAPAPDAASMANRASKVAGGTRPLFAWGSTPPGHCSVAHTHTYTHAGCVHEPVRNHTHAQYAGPCSRRVTDVRCPHRRERACIGSATCPAALAKAALNHAKRLLQEQRQGGWRLRRACTSRGRHTNPGTTYVHRESARGP